MSTNYQPGPSSSALPSSSRPTPRRRQPIASTSKPKPSTNGNSSDDRDDFFTRRKPATTTRTTTTKAPAPRRVPGSRAPAAASVVQAVAVTVATTSVAGSSSAIKRKPSAIALSSSSSSSSNGPSDDDDSSDEGGGGGGISAKPVNLPQWAKVSGADLKKQAMGSKPNRKKRRMSVDSDEESESGSGSEDGDGEETGDDTDDSVLGKKKKKKGKGKAKGKGKESPKKNDRRRVMRIPSADEDADEADSEDDIKELIIDPPSSATRSSRSRRLDSIPAAARGEDESTPRATRSQPIIISSPSSPSSGGGGGGLEFLDSDENDDTVILNPEMLRIQQSVLAGTFKRTSPSSDEIEIVGGEASGSWRERSQSARIRSSSVLQPDEEEGGEEGEKEIEVKVRMVMDPKVTSLVARKHYEKERVFWIDSKAPFSQLFNSLSISLGSGLNPSTLILTYKQFRVYPFGTPKSLKIFKGPVEFTGYTEDVFELIEKKREEEKRRRKEEGDLESEDGGNGKDDEVGGGGTSRQASALPLDLENDSDSAAGHDPSLLRLTIRGSATQSLSLALKPSTLISSLLKAYCKKFDVSKERMKKMWIEFDGEKLEGKKRLEEFEGEIEDEETVEVREGK